MNPIEEKVPQEYRKGIVIFADGRCSRNGSADAVMGGSYMTFKEGKQVVMSHKENPTRHAQLSLHHEFLTSPVAECMTLLDVLNYIGVLRRNNTNLPHIMVCMDNDMAVNFANQVWKAKEPHLKTLRSMLVDHPANTDAVTIKWVPREIIANILGH
jgi:ribonuclease HI